MFVLDVLAGLQRTIALNTKETMTYAACILWTVFIAIWSAYDDAEEIAAGVKLNKALQWCVRALGVTAFCVAAGQPWLSVGMGALFSMVFRFTLNKLRGLDWRYVSPSSWYDFMLIWGCWYREGHARPTPRLRRTAQIYHRNLYPEVDFLNLYREAVHRAGLLAYIVEGLVVLIFALFV